MRMPCNASGAASADAPKIGLEIKTDAAIRNGVLDFDPPCIGENQGVAEVELEGVAIDENVAVRCSAGEQAGLEECPEKSSSLGSTVVLELVL